MASVLVMALVLDKSKYRANIFAWNISQHVQRAKSEMKRSDTPDQATCFLLAGLISHPA